MLSCRVVDDMCDDCGSIARFINNRPNRAAAELYLQKAIWSLIEKPRTFVIRQRQYKVKSILTLMWANVGGASPFIRLNPRTSAEATGPSASRGMPVYSPAFAGTHPGTLSWCWYTVGLTSGEIRTSDLVSVIHSKSGVPPHGHCTTIVSRVYLLLTMYSNMKWRFTWLTAVWGSADRQTRRWRWFQFDYNSSR